MNILLVLANLILAGMLSLAADLQLRCAHIQERVILLLFGVPPLFVFFHCAELSYTSRMKLWKN